MNKLRTKNIIGWLSLMISLGFFFLQIGYLVISRKHQVEYVDDRLFYLINIICFIFLFLALLLLIKPTKKLKLVGASILFIFIVGQIYMLISSNQIVKNTVSVSPDLKHVLSIKENMENGDVAYYRDYYRILARPKEVLPHEIKGELKIEWLADDVAAVTFETEDNTIQQFVATYGYRGDGLSYYEVGSVIHGKWQGENIELITGTEGLTVTEKGIQKLFEWDEIEQFGTLAIVLNKNNEAVWTVALNDNFEVPSDYSLPTEGNITLYKATMEDNEPIILDYGGNPELVQ